MLNNEILYSFNPLNSLFYIALQKKYADNNHDTHSLHAFVKRLA